MVIQCPGCGAPKTSHKCSYCGSLNHNSDYVPDYTDNSLLKCFNQKHDVKKLARVNENVIFYCKTCDKKIEFGNPLSQSINEVRQKRGFPVLKQETTGYYEKVLQFIRNNG